MTVPAKIKAKAARSLPNMIVGNEPKYGARKEPRFVPTIAIEIAKLIDPFGALLMINPHE